MSGDQPVFQSLSVNGIAVDPGLLDDFAQKELFFRKEVIQLGLTLK